MNNKKVFVPALPSTSKKVPKVPRTNKSKIVALDKGKTPPNAIDLEEAIIGALLNDKTAIVEVFNILEPHYFYLEIHQIIYTAIQNLHKDNNPVDLLTVSLELKRKSKLKLIGGDFYLIGLMQRVSSSAHIEYHSRIVIQQYIKRRLIQKSNTLIKSAYEIDVDVFNIMEDMSSDIAFIKSKVVNAGTGKSLNAKEELRAKVEARRRGDPTGLFFHIYDFDEWTGGIQDRELITIAARPGMGKTTLVLIIASYNAFNLKISIALFSLEMSENDLKARLASGATQIPYVKIRKGDLNDDELDMIEAYYDFIDNSCLHIVEKMTALELIVNKIRELVSVYGVKAVLIDYVQLMTMLHSKGASDRTAELSTITRTLKALANELDIPIIILAQLSRVVDNRPGHRPVLADLKQSGSIEEDSDMVLFMLRMAAYDSAKGLNVPDHMVGKTEIITGKGRSTGLKNFWIDFNFKNFDLSGNEQILLLPPPVSD